MKDEKQLLVVSDFDGSLAENDIGHRIYTEFSGGRNGPAVQLWKQMKITTQECLRRETALIAETTLEQLYSFLDSFHLRRGADRFRRELAQNGVPFYIVSDGSSLYVEHVLKKHRFGGVEVFCNAGSVVDGRLTIEFPYDNRGCRRCGCCKGARIRDIRERYDYPTEVVFIGDGLSDICAASEADIIFARGDFLDYCRREGIKAVEYDNFFDILNYLKKTGKIKN